MFLKLLMLLLCIFSFSLRAQVHFKKKVNCYIVSGLNKDWNGAFEQAIEMLKQKNLRSCEKFKDWKKLSLHIEMKNFDPQKVKFLILQVAHGSSTGGASFDSRYYGGKKILNFIKKISHKYETAVYLDSCYSAELLKRKLINDLNNPKDPSIANLCMWAGSSFGRVTYHSDVPKLLLNSVDKTIEDIFTESAEGLISSAKWSGSGLVDYINDENLNDRFNILKKIQDYALLAPNSKLAMATELIYSDKVSLEEFRNLLGINAGMMVASVDGIKKYGFRIFNRSLSHQCKDILAESLGDIRYIEVRNLLLKTRALKATESKFQNCDFDYYLPTKVGKLIKMYSKSLKYLEELTSLTFEASTPINELLAALSNALHFKESISSSEMGRKEKFILDGILGKKIVKEESIYLTKSGFYTLPFEYDFMTTQILGVAFSVGSITNKQAIHPTDFLRQRACQQFTLE